MFKAVSIVNNYKLPPKNNYITVDTFKILNNRFQIQKYMRIDYCLEIFTIIHFLQIYLNNKFCNF